MTERELDTFLAPLAARFASEVGTSGDVGAGCLAMFHCRDLTVEYDLPIELPDLEIASESFHLRPLLGFLQSSQPYFLLSVGQNHVRFFRGDPHGLRPFEVPGLPHSLVDALGEEDRERMLNLHTAGRETTTSHGLGKEVTWRDEDLARFMRVLDEQLWPVLREETAPLILAAVERWHATWRSATRYTHVTEHGIQGNFEHATLESLHERAWPIVESIVRTRAEAARERYEQSISPNRALDEVRAIAVFAVQGRVRELLLARETRLWGRIDKTTGDVHLHGDEKGAADDDVLDDLAEAVLLHGGSVTTLDADRMPTTSPIAAILRW